MWLFAAKSMINKLWPVEPQKLGIEQRSGWYRQNLLGEGNRTDGYEWIGGVRTRNQVARREERDKRRITENHSSN